MGDAIHQSSTGGSNSCPGISLLVLPIYSNIRALCGQVADPSDLVFIGLVIEMKPVPIQDSLQNWVITTTVEKVKSGRLEGKTVSFRIHSPARAGLAKGERYQFNATGINGGYEVSEFNILPNH
jgi:hypothetical protein